MPGVSHAFFIDVRSIYKAENRHSAIAEVTKYVTKDESMLLKKLAPEELVGRLKTLDTRFISFILLKMWHHR